MWNHEDDDETNSLGRWPNPAIDQATLLEAYAFLEPYSHDKRNEWLNKLESVFERFAVSIQWIRQVCRIGVFTQAQWHRHSPPHVGPLPTDIQMLGYSTLRELEAFQDLLRGIDEHSQLAELILISLLVERDAQWNDGASVNDARNHFDNARPSIARMVHDKMRLISNNRKSGGKGGHARSNAYQPLRESAVKIGRSLRRNDNKLSDSELISKVHYRIGKGHDGKKPTNKAIQTWLRTAKLIKPPKSRPRKKR